MTEQDVKDLIEAFIVANGVNAITADVLRPILIAMLSQPNDEIGDLTALNTSTQSDLVSAINEIYNSISNISNDGIKLYEGTDTPIITPPSFFNIADFYIEKDGSNNPIQLWQYNGIEWVKANGSYLNSTAFPDTKYPYTGSNNFTIPEKVEAISVRKNGSPTEVNITDWKQLGNTVTYQGTLVSGDYLIIGGIYVNLDSGGGGAVDSVNGKTGVVVLDASDIAQVTDKNYVTDAEKTAIGTISDKQDKPIVITANKTAVNAEVYHNIGNNTFTDPTGVTGKGYYVNNISGIATIGGVAYAVGSYLSRLYDGTSWITNVIKNGTTQKDVTTSRDYLPSDHNCLLKIKANVTLTIPASGLQDDFTLVARTFTGATLTNAKAVGVTTDAPTGLILPPFKMQTLFKDGSTNTYIISGELTT